MSTVGARSPGPVPWQMDASLAQLALGEREEAKALAEQAVNGAGTAELAGARGAALRASALVAEPVDLELLADSVSASEGSERTIEHA
jgi:hypothetical protein